MLSKFTRACVRHTSAIQRRNLASAGAIALNPGSSGQVSLGERLRGAPLSAGSAPYKDTVYAEQLMTPASQDTIFAVKRTASIAEATSMMNDADIGSVVVTDDWDCVMGIFTERDYIEKAVAKGIDPHLTSVSSLMTANPTCAVTRDTLEHIVKTMVELQCRHVPVLGRKHQESVQDKDNPPHSKAVVGMISISDIIKKLLELNDGLNVSNWDVSKAASWIASLGEIYKGYAENFVANQVDGEVLLKYVDQDSIRDLVDMKLHQRVVLGALDHLKAQNSGDSPRSRSILTAESVIQQRRERRNEDVPLVTVKSTDSVDKAVDKMVSTGVGATLVRDGDYVAGIVTERDFLVTLADRKSWSDMTVSDLMTADLTTVSVTQTVDNMLSLMTDAGVRHLPVFEAGADDQDGTKCLGIISSKDVLRTLYLS